VSGTARILLALVLGATALRFVNLDSQLWLDEISALTGSIDRPFREIVTEWPGSASHILYELSARAGLLTLGEPDGIRFPAAVFGVAGVALMYVFALRAFGQRPAWVTAGLLAVSYHHVMFSQNARGYTLLIALYLATLVLLVEIQRRERPTGWLLALYSLAGALAAYSMPMGWFILPGQALVILALWWRARRTGAPPLPPILIGAAAVGGLLAGLLYAPFVPAIVRFTRMNAAAAEDGPRLGWGLVREVVDGLLVAFHGPVGLIVVAVFGVFGLAAWWRRHPVSLLLAVAPIVLELVAVVAVGVGIHPRYFAIVLPVLLIVAGLGLESVVTAVLARAPVPAIRGAFAANAALATVVLLSAWPLMRYYRYPKQDFLGAIATVEAHRPACRARVGVDVAGHVLDGYYRVGFVTAEDLGELRALEAGAGNGTVCVVTTLEGLLAISDPEIVAHLRQHYRRVAFLPGTVGDAAMRVYARNQP
jgi:mannosyltransferase